MTNWKIEEQLDLDSFHNCTVKALTALGWMIPRCLLLAVSEWWQMWALVIKSSTPRDLAENMIRDTEMNDSSLYHYTTDYWGFMCKTFSISGKLLKSVRKILNGYKSFEKDGVTYNRGLVRTDLCRLAVAAIRASREVGDLLCSSPSFWRHWNLIKQPQKTIKNCSRPERR